MPDIKKEANVDAVKQLAAFKQEELKEALHRENVNAVAITNESIANEIIDILR